MNSDSLFDNEWMTAKIDLTSGLAEQLDSNFNLLTDDTQIQSTSPLVSVETEMQFSSVITALLGDKSINAEKLDLTKTSSGNIEDSVLEDFGPVSPEQHVPDLDGEQFKAILDSFLAVAKTSGQEDSPLDDPIVGTTAGNSLATKRKFFETAPQGPKPKVKTPEQKQRKRLQNRNAATKYRSKKRSEQDTLNAKCVELDGDNVELQKKIESKTQEIQYLKNLIIDVFSKKRA